MWQITRFAVYEEYGANYELVQRDVDDTQRSIFAWPDFDRAIELLSAHVNPMQSQEANRKKAMTIKDLLIKVSIRPIDDWCHFRLKEAIRSPYSGSQDMS